jgi:flagellar biosynthetic protein FlhB
VANSGERTEKPTHRRRKQAQDDGQYPYSREFTSALILVITLAVLLIAAGPVKHFRALMETLLSGVAGSPQADQVLAGAIRHSGMAFLALAAPILGAAFFASLAGNVLQGLPRAPTQASTLRWDHLKPSRGLAKLKTKFSWMEWTKILILVVFTVAVVWTALAAFWEQVVTLPARDVASSTQLVSSLATRVALYLGGIAVVLGVGDYFLQRWRFEKSLMQTKSEVMEDMKAMDGNPVIRRQVRTKQRQQAMRRMMSRVKDADVIVTNPTHFAVALEYKPATMAAPRVVAKGRDKLAQRIKRLGQLYDIPTVENVSLARALYKSVALEQEIPPALFKAVAEVLAYVLRVRKRM